MICFTGHRPNKLGGYQPNSLQDWIRKELKIIIQRAIDKGERDFMSGMALGVDQWAAEIVLYLGGVLHCALPFPSQSSVWPTESKKHYYELLDYAVQSGGLIYKVSSDPYSAEKMQARNEFMVDRSSHVIAVWDDGRGGTGNCVRYAQQLKRPIYQINPKTRKAEWL